MSTAKKIPTPHDGRQQNPAAGKEERVKGQEEDFDKQRTDPRDQPERYGKGQGAPVPPGKK